MRGTRACHGAILTNFETMKVFSAEWDEVEPDRSLVFEVKYDDYAASQKPRHAVSEID